ncbi:MAG: hypothetical protein IH995_07425 [Proteobacteria bacterium]|nr:hypothetical protein [Pseudomonadota bacterium]
MTKRGLIKVASVAQTCFACPAQWQGETEDGQEIYVRYRWGWLEVHLGGVLTEPILDLQLGGEWHGEMTFEDLKKHTKEIISWPEKCL